MTEAEYQRRLEEIEAKADEAGCCIVLAKPLPEPEQPAKE